MKARWIVLGVSAVAGTTLLYATGVLDVVAFLAVALREVHPSEAQMDQIYSAVATRSLKPDAAGVVGLPQSMASATIDGKVYVTRRGNLLMVLFPTWRGKGSNVSGYLRCNRPLTPADTSKDPSGTTTISVFAPGLWSTPPGYAPIPPSQRQTPVALEKELENNTFSVSYRLD